MSAETRTPMALFHCLVRFGLARLVTARLSLRFHCSLVPLQSGWDYSRVVIVVPRLLPWHHRKRATNKHTTKEHIDGIVFFTLGMWMFLTAMERPISACFRRGFFRGWHPCMPFLCSVRRIVSREIVTPVWLSTSLDNCSEIACRFSSTLLIRRRSWRGVNFRGRPGRLCEMVAVPSFLNVCTTFATVFWLISNSS